MNTLIRRTARLRAAGPHGLGRGTRLLRRQQVAPNLLTGVASTSFETDTTGWSQNNATITRTAGGLFGDFRAVLAWTGVSSFYQMFHAAVAINGATAGRQFTFSYYVRGAGSAIGKAVVIRLTESGGAQAAQSHDSSPVTLTADWQRVPLTITLVQNDRTSLQGLVGRRVASLVSGESMDIDAVKLEESSAATPFTE